jgi:hypothetical protein
VSRPAWLLAQNRFFICGASGCYRPRGALTSLKRAILGLKMEIGIFRVYMRSGGAPGVYTKSVPRRLRGIYRTSTRATLSGRYCSGFWYIPGDDCGERGVYTWQNPPVQMVYTRHGGSRPIYELLTIIPITCGGIYTICANRGYIPFVRAYGPTLLAGVLERDARAGPDIPYPYGPSRCLTGGRLGGIYTPLDSYGPGVRAERFFSIIPITYPLEYIPLL